MKIVKEALNEKFEGVEKDIEPWGQNMELIDKLLDEFEKEYYSLEEHSWEEIQAIKKALWLGYNYSR